MTTITNKPNTFKKTNIYAISSKNYKSMDNLEFLSSGIWSFPNLSFENEDIVNVNLSIFHAELPNTFQIVNYTNNKLVTSLGTFTFTKGNYNIVNFITMALSILPVGFSITYSSTVNKLTFGYTSSFTIYASQSTINPLIGLGNSNIIGSSFTLPYSVNLLPIARINLKSKAFQLNNFSSSNSGDLILTIQNNGSQNGRILYQNYDGSSFKLNIKNLSAFDLRFTDDDDNLINFNAVDWFISFKIEMECLEKPKPPTFEQIINQQTVLNTKNKIVKTI